MANKNSFVLRRLKMSDAQAIAQNLNNKKVSRYLTESVPFPYTIRDAKDFLQRTIPQYKKQYRNRTSFVMGIEIGGQICGCVGLHNIAFGHKAEIGYWLAEPYWNQKIMSVAVSMFVESCIEKFALKRIFAKVLEPNEASLHVLLVNFFYEEGILEKEAKRGDEIYDVIMLARIES